MQHLGRITNTSGITVSLFVPRGGKYSPAPNQVGGAIGPRGQWAKDDEPENDSKQAIVRLHANSCLDTTRALSIFGHSIFHDGLRGIIDLLVIPDSSARNTHQLLHQYLADPARRTTRQSQGTGK